MAQQFRMEFMQIPVVTRVYTTACILTTVAVVRSFFITGVQHTHLMCDLFPFQQLNIVSPLQLLYHPQLVMQGEVRPFFLSANVDEMVTCACRSINFVIRIENLNCFLVSEEIPWSLVPLYVDCHLILQMLLQAKCYFLVKRKRLY